MTPVDDLKVGGYVAVVGVKDNDQPEPFGFFTPRPKAFDGLPVQITAISLPFVAVKDARGNIGAFDVRTFDLQIVSRRYAEAMQLAKPKRRRKRKEKPDPQWCVRCGGRLLQRLSKDSKFAWHVVCPECGWDGGPVPK